MDVTAAEVRSACKEMMDAYSRITFADPDFEDAAWMDYKAKVARYEALLRRYKLAS